MNPYCYIIVRKDISTEQIAVQAAHAALELGYRCDTPLNTTHIVLLEVANEENLLKISEELTFNGKKHYLFHEPDFGIGYSALATEPSTKRIKFNLPLYKCYYKQN